METADNDLISATPLENGSAQNKSVAFPSRILLADDDADICGVVKSILGDAGYHVTTAKDGEMAWDALNRDNFDLLITDHDMPRVTGLALVRRVRRTDCQLPVIMISGKMPWDEMDLYALLHPGVALEKPFSLAKLLLQVRSLLARRPNYQEKEPRAVDTGRLS